jgi:hypothetical protein
LNARAIEENIREYYLFFIFNSDVKFKAVKIPEHHEIIWRRVVDTSGGPGNDFFEEGCEVIIDDQASYNVDPRSVVVLIGR